MSLGRILDDAPGENASADRHSHTRADRRNRDAVRNAIREEIEERDRDCDGNQAHGCYGSVRSVRMARTRFISSHTSRFEDGLRSRYAG